MTTWQIWVLAAYCGIVLVLGVYGFHRWLMLRLFFRHQPPARPAPFAELPRVTVQLPRYNTLHAAGRLIDAVCRLDYFRDRLQVQARDDSTDQTIQIARDAVAGWQGQGVDITYHHRTDRRAFKGRRPRSGLSRGGTSSSSSTPTSAPPCAQGGHPPVHRS